MAKKSNKRVPFLSYDEAKALIQSELIPSRRKYDEWFDRNKPKVIPRFPNRVYKEWVSWNDFLGNNNEFKGRTVKWRDINEATMFIHTQKIPSFNAWMEWVKIPGNLPPDIPARPDLTYSKWVSWPHWLGNRPIEAVQAKEQAQRVQIFYLIRYPDTPLNIIHVGVEPMGIAGMKAMWEQRNYEIVKLFWFDVEKADIVQHIVKSLSTPYLESNNQRVAFNVHEIVWELSKVLDTVDLAAATRADSSNQTSEVY